MTTATEAIDMLIVCRVVAEREYDHLWDCGDEAEADELNKDLPRYDKAILLARAGQFKEAAMIVRAFHLGHPLSNECDVAAMLESLV